MNVPHNRNNRSGMFGQSSTRWFMQVRKQQRQNVRSQAIRHERSRSICNVAHNFNWDGGLVCTIGASVRLRQQKKQSPVRNGQSVVINGKPPNQVMNLQTGPDSRRRRRNASLARLVALALPSGCASLIYELCWVQHFTWLTGNAFHAASSVIALFLLGLACGAWAARRVRLRGRASLLLLAGVELTIAMASLAGWLAIRFLSSHEDTALIQAVLSSDLAVRALLLPMALFPSTLLMGATVPILTSTVRHDTIAVRRAVPLVIAANTCGAVIGCLLTGLYLVENWGLDGAVVAAVFLSLATALLALLLGGKNSSAEAASVTTNATDASPALPRAGKPWPAALFPLGAVAFANGLALLALEIIWSRALTPFVGSSSYALTAILASFLLALAVGTLLSRLWVSRKWLSVTSLGWQQLATAVLALLSSMAIVYITQSTFIGDSIANSQREIWTYSKLALCLFVVAPTVIVGGMTIPAGIALAQTHLSAAPRAVGVILFFGTLGNVAGVLAANWLIIPQVGVLPAITVCASICLSGAVLCLYWQMRSQRWWHTALATVVLLAVVIAGATRVQHSASKTLASAHANESYDVLFQRDGPVSSVSVLQSKSDAADRRLAVDGVVIGETGGLVSQKQQILAHLPFLFSQNDAPQSVLTIGLGTGILSGEVLKNDRVQHLDCVELSPSVVEAAGFFSETNHRVLEDPRLRVHIGDGIRFVRQSQTRYDAIISDGKSATTHIGNAGFHSREYYAACRRRLKPSGLFVQWIPTDVSHTDLKTIVKTFTTAFAQGVLVVHAPGSAFLVGSPQKLQLDPERMDRYLQDEERGRAMRKLDWTNAPTVCALIVADVPGLEAALVDHSRVNHWFHPVLAYHSFPAYRQGDDVRIAANLNWIDELLRGTLEDVVVLNFSSQTLGDYRQATRRVIEAEIAEVQGHRDPYRRIELGREASELAPQHAVARALWSDGWQQLGTQYLEQGDALRAGRAFDLAVKVAPADMSARRTNAHYLYETDQLAAALPQLSNVVRACPDDHHSRLKLGWCLGLQGELGPAGEHFRKVLSRAPDTAQAHLGLGIVLWHSDQRSLARSHLQQAREIDPSTATDVERILSGE